MNNISSYSLGKGSYQFLGIYFIIILWKVTSGLVEINFETTSSILLILFVGSFCGFLFYLFVGNLNINNRIYSLFWKKKYKDNILPKQSNLYRGLFVEMSIDPKKHKTKILDMFEKINYYYILTLVSYFLIIILLIFFQFIYIDKYLQNITLNLKIF